MVSSGLFAALSAPAGGVAGVADCGSLLLLGRAGAGGVPDCDGVPIGGLGVLGVSGGVGVLLHATSAAQAAMSIAYDSFMASALIAESASMPTATSLRIDAAVAHRTQAQDGVGRVLAVRAAIPEPGRNAAPFGAIQVGMLRELVAHGVRPDRVVGSSVGALNGAHFAADPTMASVMRLEDIWRGLRRQDSFPVKLRRLAGLFFGSAARVDSGG